MICRTWQRLWLLLMICISTSDTSTALCKECVCGGGKLSQNGKKTALHSNLILPTATLENKEVIQLLLNMGATPARKEQEAQRIRTPHLSEQWDFSHWLQSELLFIEHIFYTLNLRYENRLCVTSERFPETNASFRKLLLECTTADSGWGLHDWRLLYENKLKIWGTKMLGKLGCNHSSQNLIFCLEGD